MRHVTVRPMARIGAGGYGESSIRMLRIARRGDRHDPRELSVSCHFDGDFSPAFREGRSGGLIPGEVLRNVVHRLAHESPVAEIEAFGMSLCARLLADHPAVTRVRIDVTERAWTRLDVAGRPQGQAFMAGSPEVATAAVIGSGSRLAVISGVERLSLMRSSGFTTPDDDPDDGRADGLQPLLVAELACRWTYTSPDVTFRSYRQGVRTALIDTFSWHHGRSIQHTLFAMADVVLATYEEIAEVTLVSRERPYRAADLFMFGEGAAAGLFVPAEEPVGTVEVTVERGGPGGEG